MAALDKYGLAPDPVIDCYKKIVCGVAANVHVSLARAYLSRELRRSGAASHE